MCLQFGTSVSSLLPQHAFPWDKICRYLTSMANSWIRPILGTLAFCYSSAMFNQSWQGTSSEIRTFTLFFSSLLFWSLNTILVISRHAIYVTGNCKQCSHSVLCLNINPARYEHLFELCDVSFQSKLVLIYCCNKTQLSCRWPRRFNFFLRAGHDLWKGKPDLSVDIQAWWIITSHKCKKWLQPQSKF